MHVILSSIYYTWTENSKKGIILANGANPGIKAVLHVVNKFGAGQNNVAHLCV